MVNYKADITLNERDSILDMLSIEKQTVKAYSTAITEGVSKEFREVIKNNLDSGVDDQFMTFMMACEYGHAKVCSADEENLKSERERFVQIGRELN